MIVEIVDLSSSGEGVGKIAGKTVFVDGALPGEVVEIELKEEKKRYCKARLRKICNESPARTLPICPLFGTCGGCQIMHLSYEEQIKWKQTRVKNALQRIGQIDHPVDPCVPSPDMLGYRNKIHLQEGGFHKRHSHEIVPISRCYIHNDIGEHYLPQARSAKEAIIRTSLSTGEVLLDLDGKTNRPYLIETLGDLQYKIRPRDFFQVNPKQAKKLYEKAVELAALGSNSRVLDAYCGVGTLSLFAAKKAGEVIGIESGKAAVKSAKENAQLNKIENVRFICDLVERRLPTMEPFSAVFLNPPRGGVQPTVLQSLENHPPDALLYISCDPATLSRDLLKLKDVFTIEKVIPFDMFPQTVHVETLVLLKREKF